MKGFDKVFLKLDDELNIVREKVESVREDTKI